MPKHNAKFFVSRDGMLYIEDMSPLEAQLLKSIGIKIDTAQKDLSVYTGRPNYAALKNIRVPSPLPGNIEALVDLHDNAITNPQVYCKEKIKTGISIFRLKKKILNAYLKGCNLCGYRCGGYRADAGKCPITRPSGYYQYFVHLGEEKEIGTTAVIEMTGCNMYCRFCQKGELISGEPGSPLTISLWKDLEKEYTSNGFNNISFLGGNPDQSIGGGIDFLEYAPEWASSLPIVWHTNGYSAPELYNLLNGLVDLWVFDFKYFDNDCALSLSNTPDYAGTAKGALKTICDLSKDTPVIVRHLILPGHWSCCQRPLIEWLRVIKKHIIFHPMPQYKPVCKITEKDGRLSRPIEKAEAIKVRDYASNAGFALTECPTLNPMEV